MRGGRSTRVNVELGEDVAHVRGHCPVAETKQLSDLPISASLGQKNENLVLSLRESTGDDWSNNGINGNVC